VHIKEDQAHKDAQKVFAKSFVLLCGIPAASDRVLLIELGDAEAGA